MASPLRRRARVLPRSRAVARKFNPNDVKQLALGVPRLLIHKATVLRSIELEFESETDYLTRVDLLTQIERGALGGTR